VVLKFILEPFLEADFQPGSYVYRLEPIAHAAVYGVGETAVLCKTCDQELEMTS